MLQGFSIENKKLKKEALPELPLSEGNCETLRWIDALEPTEAEREILEGLLRIEVPEAEEINEIESSARFFIGLDGLHVHSLFLDHSGERPLTVSVACILQDKRLITIRDHELADFRLFRRRAYHGLVSCNSPSEILITLLEQKVENLADHLEYIHHELEEVSRQVLEEANSKLEAAIERLAQLEDNTGKVRLCLMDTQRAISFLQRHLRDSALLQDNYREMMRDIDTLMSHTSFLFDKINFLMDSTQGFISIEQNKVIKIFSIAAVVFLPPTLVASIYGMNFEFMPELHWVFGYPMAIGLMIIAALAPYLFFKYKGWL